MAKRDFYCSTFYKAKNAKELKYLTTSGEKARSMLLKTCQQKNLQCEIYCNWFDRCEMNLLYKQKTWKKFFRLYTTVGMGKTKKKACKSALSQCLGHVRKIKVDGGLYKCEKVP